MPLTTEERIELLKKAREAKKAKAEAKKQEKIDNPPPKGRPKKKQEEVILPSKEEIEEVEKINNLGNKKTLDLRPSVVPKELTSVKEPENPEELDEEVEEIIEVQKVKRKPKKKIVRKIIKQEYESNSEDEEIQEEVIYEPPKRNRHTPRVARARIYDKQESQTEPRESVPRQNQVPVPIHNPFFNY